MLAAVILAVAGASSRLIRSLRDPASRYAALSVLTAIPVLIFRGKQMVGALAGVLFVPSSILSIYSLGGALVISVGAIVGARRRRGRGATLGLLRRALFPRRLCRGPSLRADLGFAFLNNFATGALIGWALLSTSAISNWVFARLCASFGPSHGPALPIWLADAVLTVALFGFAELAYWLDHYTSHHVPFFWAFHRVHHTAETLTPLTIFRVHPVESLTFYNINAITLGLSHGALAYGLGVDRSGWMLWGANLFTMTYGLTLGSLLHTHVWIAFRGTLGKIFISPAHHQLHHSMDPAHFGKNLGGALAIFDWAFGTLLIPTARRQRITFGVREADSVDPHSITGCIISPCMHAAKTLRIPGVSAPIDA